MTSCTSPPRLFVVLGIKKDLEINLSLFYCRSYRHLKFIKFLY
nr:MAG TPA: hypothetical protein [Bacteriophage sp.]